MTITDVDVDLELLLDSSMELWCIVCDHRSFRSYYGADLSGEHIMPNLEVPSDQTCVQCDSLYYAHVPCRSCGFIGCDETYDSECRKWYGDGS